MAPSNMDSFHFNNFDIKRRAHTATRRDSTMSWNPFRHFSWENSPRKAKTDPSSLEAHSRSRTLRTDVSPIPRDMLSTPVATPQDNIDSASLRNRKQQQPLANGEPAQEPRPALEKKKSSFIRHVQPKTPFTTANQIQRTILSSWINLLLFAAPVGIALNYIPATKGVPVFIVNFIAIIPLAAMLSFATEEIALRTGGTLGGLLNASFGNAVELIVAIIALKQGKITIVQTSLIGSILSNLLLVMGCCFLFGGLKRREQYFNTTAAQTAASLLLLAVGAVIVPTVFDSQLHTGLDRVAPISRGAAVILLIVYAGFLLFQLKTHREIISAEGQKVAPIEWRKTKHQPKTKQDSGVLERRATSSGSDHDPIRPEDARMTAETPQEQEHQNQEHTDAIKDEDEDIEEPQLHFAVAVATLVGATVIIAFCAEFMVDGIDAVTKSVSEEFVGLILLPIVGNAAEHATAVTVALKDKMDLAIGVAVGSSMQIALFVIPLVVIVGWGLQIKEMTLSFDVFQVAVLFVSVLLVVNLIWDGKSHWLEGFLLICLWAIIAVCSFYYPNTNAIE